MQIMRNIQPEQPEQEKKVGNLNMRMVDGDLEMLEALCDAHMRNHTSMIRYLIRTAYRQLGNQGRD